MRISAMLVDGPVPRSSPTGDDVSGARLTFDGIVRPLEGGNRIRALWYDAYEPMAQLQFLRLAGDMCVRHGLSGVHVVHSRGCVPVHEASVRVTIDSVHRAEGLKAMAAFLDRMKIDVPIWKRVVA